MSGTLKTGEKVKLKMSCDSKDIEKCIQTVIIRRLDENGNIYEEYIERDDGKFISCGSICMIGGMDNYTTVWDQFLHDPHIKRESEKDPEPTVTKFITHNHHLFELKIEVESAPQYSKMYEYLVKFSLIQSNPNIRFKESYDDYFILSSSSHSLLLKGLEQFKELIGEEDNVKIGDIYSVYNETVSQRSLQILSKSPNKWTRLFVRAEPLQKDDAIENYPFGISFHDRQKHKYFVIRHGNNLLVDCTVGVFALKEIVRSISAGMNLMYECGVLCEQEVTGIKFSLEDCSTHCDAMRRGAGQVITVTRRVLRGCELSGQVRLLEGLLNVHVIGRKDDTVKVVSLLKERNEELKTDHVILSENENEISPMVNLHFKVVTSEFIELFSKFEEMKESGMMISIYSHFNGELIEIEGDPFEEGTKSNQIAKKLRAMKGLPPNLPQLEDYNCDSFGDLRNFWHVQILFN